MNEEEQPDDEGEGEDEGPKEARSNKGPAEPPELGLYNPGRESPSRGQETKPAKKRKYNFSDKCLAARRANALKSTGPTSVEGKATAARNSWRHGLNAASTALGMVGKPCLSTCRKYPCSLVDDGATQPGSHCLDKEFFLDTLQRIQIAIQDKQFDGVNEIFGLALAKTFNILNDLQDRLLSEGTIVKHAKMDKDGKLIGWEHALNPALITLPKLLGALGVSFDSLLLTPAAIAKAAQGKEDDKKEDAMTVMARIVEKMADVKVKP